MTVDDVCAEAGASPLEEIEDLTTPSQQALHQLLLYGHEGLPVLDEDGRPWSEPMIGWAVRRRSSPADAR